MLPFAICEVLPLCPLWLASVCLPAVSLARPRPVSFARHHPVSFTRPAWGWACAEFRSGAWQANCEKFAQASTSKALCKHPLKSICWIFYHQKMCILRVQMVQRLWHGKTPSYGERSASFRVWGCWEMGGLIGLSSSWQRELEGSRLLYESVLMGYYERMWY